MIETLENHGDVIKTKKRSFLEPINNNNIKKNNFLGYFLTKPKNINTEETKNMSKKNIYKSNDNLREFYEESDLKKAEVKSPYQNFFKTKGGGTQTPLRGRKSILKLSEEMFENEKIERKEKNSSFYNKG